jgi:ribonuclease BN (tRNA processing enzyme)
MSELSFIPLGVGDAFSARHYTSCIAVGAGGSWILIDCPHPIRKVLREGSERAGMPLDLDRIDAAVITHLHADHASGIEDYGYWFHFALHRKARLAMHPAVALDLWDGHLAAGMSRVFEPGTLTPGTRALEDWFEIVPLDESRAVHVGPFALECRRTIHPVPATALRISAGGRILGHSSDTAFDPSLVSWLAGADLFIYETNRGIHTPYESLAALPADVRAKMRLIHYPDDFDQGSSVIEPLQEGTLYRV